MPEEGGREGGREGGLGIRREGGREGGRARDPEGGREGGRAREGGREGGREGEKTQYHIMYLPAGNALETILLGLSLVPAAFSVKTMYVN